MITPVVPFRATAHARGRAAARARLGQALAALPSQCEFCRRWDRGRFCAACLARFASPRPRCLRCAAPTGLPLPACGACLEAPAAPWRTVCAVDYGFPWDRCLHAFKFDGQVELARPLAALLGAALDRADAPGLAGAEAVEWTRPHRPSDPPDPNAPATLVLPVPLSAERLAERGYNQAWELARQVARARGLEARADLLRRPVDTPPQTALDRAARRRNLRGAFWVPPQALPHLAGRPVALVDDVITTGATVDEAAATLQRAGAASIEVWALARTP